MLTFLGLSHMVDATQHDGVGVGWGVITFVALAHMVDATQHDGVGGGVRKDVNVPRTFTHG